MKDLKEKISRMLTAYPPKWLPFGITREQFVAAAALLPFEGEDNKFVKNIQTAFLRETLDKDCPYANAKVRLLLLTAFYFYGNECEIQKLYESIQVKEDEYLE